MIEIAVPSIILLLIALFFGWKKYKVFFWNYVDVIYYPLAGIGICLLFLSNDIQRELFDVTQRTEQQKANWEALKSAKPNIQVRNLPDLFEANLQHLMLVKQWYDACGENPIIANPHCAASVPLKPLIQEYLRVAHSKYASYEERLAASCIQADKMLDEIRSKNAMSSLVSEKLLAQYSEASSLGIDPLNFNAVVAQAKNFRDRTAAYATQINKIAFPREDASSQSVLDARLAEIDFGEIIITGLAACISAPQNELKKFTKWNTDTDAQAAEVNKLEQQKADLAKDSNRHRLVQWIQLNLWPYILLLALGLKFAKSVANLRSAREKR